MPTSIHTQSGRSEAASLIVSRPFSASPTTSRLAWRSSNTRKPVRITVWSSANNILSFFIGFTLDGPVRLGGADPLQDVFLSPGLNPPSIRPLNDSLVLSCRPVLNRAHGLTQSPSRHPQCALGGGAPS